jgi:uncharacterized protein
MTHVVVFDTNVLLSGIGWKGRPYDCLQLARLGQIQGITCQEILLELAEKLDSKLRFSAEQIAGTLADLLTFLTFVKIAGALQVVVADPDDDKILECAVVGNATHVVTGDRRHLLPLGSFQGIAIVSPADFLQLITTPH